MKRKIQQEKYQDKLNVEEDDGNTNPKVGKTPNKSRNFQAKWLKEHTIQIRYEKRKPSHVLPFLSLGQKKTFWK